MPAPTSRLLCVDPQVDIYLGTSIELADGFCVALAITVLGVDFVVHVGRERREAVDPVLADDESFYRAGAGIGEINHGTGKGRVLLINDLSSQQTPRVAALVLGIGLRAGQHEDKSR